ncbi:MAG: SIMPL domain-containing protein [Patescibacteria group bacterium]
MEILEENKKRIFQALFILIVILSVYFAVKIFSEIKKNNMLGENTTPATISFSGHGEITAVPDIASVYFTISKDDKIVKDAQAGVAVIEKKALDFLKTKGVNEKDIKTANVSFYPKYEYRQGICPPIPMGADTAGITVNPSSPYYCPNGKQIIIGYMASESVTVKIRNTDNVGAIMQGLGITGVSDLNGPNFEIDNPDAIQTQARKKAIDDAKTKAGILVKDLGVSLGKISSFSESGNNYPIIYAESVIMKSGVSTASAPAVIPKGEHTISSDVTITYEIK